LKKSDQIAGSTQSTIPNSQSYDGDGNVSEYIDDSGAVAAHFTFFLEKSPEQGPRKI